MYKVEIEFPNKILAKTFMMWLDDQGEQYYFDACENASRPYVDIFSYDYESLKVFGAYLPAESNVDEEI